MIGHCELNTNVQTYIHESWLIKNRPETNVVAWLAIYVFTEFSITWEMLGLFVKSFLSYDSLLKSNLILEVYSSSGIIQTNLLVDTFILGIAYF